MDLARTQPLPIIRDADLLAGAADHGYEPPHTEFHDDVPTLVEVECVTAVDDGSALEAMRAVETVMPWLVRR